MCLLAANVQIVIIDLSEVVTGSAKSRASKQSRPAGARPDVVLTVSDRFVLNAVKRFLLRSPSVLAYPLVLQAVCQFDSSPKTWSGNCALPRSARVWRVSAPEIEFRRLSLLIPEWYFTSPAKRSKEERCKKARKEGSSHSYEGLQAIQATLLSPRRILSLPAFSRGKSHILTAVNQYWPRRFRGAPPLAEAMCFQLWWPTPEVNISNRVHVNRMNSLPSLR
jgi:hypothetical protein